MNHSRMPLCARGMSHVDLWARSARCSRGNESRISLFAHGSDRRLVTAPCHEAAFLASITSIGALHAPQCLRSTVSSGFLPHTTQKRESPKPHRAPATGAHRQRARTHSTGLPRSATRRDLGRATRSFRIQSVRCARDTLSLRTRQAEPSPGRTGDRPLAQSTRRVRVVEAN